MELDSKCEARPVVALGLGIRCVLEDEAAAADGLWAVER